MKLFPRKSVCLSVLALWAFLLLWSASPAQARKFHNIDFGLPLFNQEDIRLERNNTPSFNLHLLQKYLQENQEKTLAQLNGVFAAARMVFLAGADRRKEFHRVFQEYFHPPVFDAPHQAEILSYLFFCGLTLAEDEEDDPKNVKDHQLEEKILQAEDLLKDVLEYALVKGILFQRLHDRPNGFWHPMKPLEDLKIAFKLAPEDPHFLYVLGQSFRALGNDEAPLFFAVAAFEKASGFDPGNHKLQNTTLGIYMGIHEEFQSQRQKEPFWMEEAVYKKILSLSPNNPYALNNLAYLYAEHGIHRQSAQQMAQRASTLMPKNPGFRDTLGWAAFKNQQYDKAIAELKKSLSLNPDSYEANYHLGTVYYVKKDYKQAREAYEKAVQLNPNAPEALNNYAYLLAENAVELEKAKTLAGRANALEPNNPSYVDTLGWVEFQMGNYEDAVRHLKRAFQLAPDVGEILMHLGKVYIQLNDFDLGLNYLKQAIKADPNLEGIRDEIFLALNLASLHRNLADYHRIFQKSADPRHIKAILLQIARVYQDVGMYAAAIDVTQLCEQLRRRELPLDKPIFSFYAFPALATPTVEVAPSAPESSTAPIEAAALDIPAPTSPMPQIARVPMALHLGPVVFRFLARNFQVFPGFETLSLGIYLRNPIRPYSTAIFQVEVPDAPPRNLLEAARAFFQLLRSPITPLEGYGPEQGFAFRLSRYPLWALQRQNRLFIGGGVAPADDELEVLGKTFPYGSDVIAGMIMDWPATREKLPVMVGALLPNPLGKFQRVYGRYRIEAGLIQENSYLTTTEDLSADFMKDLAEELFANKVLFLQRGIQTEVRVEASAGEIHLTVAYKGLPEAVRRGLERWRLLVPVIAHRLAPSWCLARRFLFGGDVGNLPELCPAGGKVSLNAARGTLECSHPGHGFDVLPLTLNAAGRCTHSRTRLEALLKKFGEKKSPEEIGGLINQVLLDYNVLPCPFGGTYYWKAQTVRCTACHGPESEDEKRDWR